MKIVLWGTYDTGKPRIRILRKGLQELGVEVMEIHAAVWEGVSDKSSLRGTRSWLSRILRLLGAYPRLIWRYLRAPAHDFVLVSYPGQLDVLVLRVFAWARRKPLVFDWFISAYDTIVNDRRLIGSRNPIAWALWGGEWLAAHAPTKIFMDTETHARRMELMFRLAPGSIGHVRVGAEAQFFQRDLGSASHARGALCVLFYGQFIPLHGIETVIDAARLTRDQPIHWTLIGHGQESPHIRQLLANDPLPNVEWIDWLDYTDLPAAIAKADVCLGIFGTSAKAASVIPNKVFQVVAAGKALVTRDSLAIRELLRDAPPCVRLIPPGDAHALADAVRGYASAPNRHTTQSCHAATAATITAQAIARQFENMLDTPQRQSESA